MSTKPPAPGEGGCPYDADYYAIAYGDAGISVLSTHWWANRYYARIAERLLRRSGGTRLLDMGCGQGLMLAHMRPWVDAWGAEVSAYARERCARLAPAARVLAWDIERSEGPFPAEGLFDVVVARYLLEHLADPAKAMERIAALVRPGGHVLLSQPNTESPGLRLKGSSWFAYQDPTHCSLLTPSEWSGIVTGAGLRIERVFSDGLWDVPYVGWLPTVLQYPVFALPCILATFSISTSLPLSWGENWVCIARKPLDSGKPLP